MFCGFTCFDEYALGGPPHPIIVVIVTITGRGVHLKYASHPGVCVMMCTDLCTAYGGMWEFPKIRGPLMEGP